MEYRILSRADISKLKHIDRSESVDHVYYVRDGALTLEKEHWDVADWSPSEKQRRIAALQDVYDRGATFFGALDGCLLVGMSVLDHNPLPSGVDRLRLDTLLVSHRYREQGVGRKLVQLVEQVARDRGAKALYVSATPSENTVRFYRSLGFRLAEPADPDLYRKESEYVHMEMLLQ